MSRRHDSSDTNFAARDPSIPPAIDRIKEIATQAYSSLLLADGPPHPDYRLLDLCAEGLSLLRQAAECDREFRRGLEEALATPRTESKAEYDRRNAPMHERERLVKQARPFLREAGKLKATTAAGIYAKALLVRHSLSGSPLLAMSLAEDLVDCEPLRKLLWEAGADAAPAS